MDRSPPNAQRQPPCPSVPNESAPAEKAAPTTGQKRILIIRLGAIGDIVMASALIPSLRSRWPNAHLAWLVDASASDLLRHNRRLDEVIVWPRAQWRRLWHERRYRELAQAIAAMRRQLQSKRFDLVLDTQGLLKSGLLAWLTRAPERIGLGSREGSRFLMTRVLKREPDDPHIGSEYLHLAHSLGLAPEAFFMDLEPGDAARGEARKLLAESQIEGPYAIVCPFTTRLQKQWFEERWAVLIPRLQRELKLPVVMVGGPGDVEAASRIVSAAPRVCNLVGLSPLATAAALIEKCALLIGVDTGLTHMGVAFHRPTVALFGSTRPYLETPSHHARVLYEPLGCSPCRRRPTCRGEFTCMSRHDAEGVLAAARGVLETAA